MFVLNSTAVFSRTASEIVQSVAVRVGRLATELVEARKTRAAQLALWQAELKNLANEVGAPDDDLPEPITIEELESGEYLEEQLFQTEIPSLDAIGSRVSEAQCRCEYLEEQSTFWRAVEQ